MIKNVGLAFSGGGFRAASFALGTLSYLQHVQLAGLPLLQRASFVSSTSGGSITNAFYALRLYQGHQPEAIFKELYAHLSSDALLERAMATLTDAKAWAAYPHKTRNLINAFAITYDQVLFGGKTMEVFWNKAHQPHVEEVCFNSTELNNGISFRFRTNGTDADIISFGNFYLGFKKESVEALKSLRIADMVAASSCFPVGFEPIVFPNDFAAEEETPESLLNAFEFDHNNSVHKDAVQAVSFGLIDGGVVDNQGLYSLGLEDSLRPPKSAAASEPSPKGKPEPRPFDLLIACDVASYFLDPYEVPSEPTKWYLKIPLKWIVVALALIVPLTGVTVGIFAANREPWYYFLLLLPAYLSSGLIGYGFWKAARALQKEKRQVHGKVLGRYLGKLLNMRLSKISELLQARGRSFAQLALEVYLKQIRRLHLDKTYRNSKVSLRMISNFIYELGAVHRDRRVLENKKPENAWWPQYAAQLQPSALLEKTADAARQVATTLWFDPHNKADLDAVAATGQFTTCYNLIRYLNRIEQAEGPLSPDLIALREVLLIDWAKFQADPKWMLGELR